MEGTELCTGHQAPCRARNLDRSCGIDPNTGSSLVEKNMGTFVRNHAILVVGSSLLLVGRSVRPRGGMLTHSTLRFVMYVC